MGVADHPLSSGGGETTTSGLWFSFFHPSQSNPKPTRSPEHIQHGQHLYHLNPSLSFCLNSNSFLVQNGKTAPSNYYSVSKLLLHDHSHQQVWDLNEKGGGRKIRTHWGGFHHSLGSLGPRGLREWPSHHPKFLFLFFF